MPQRNRSGCVADLIILAIEVFVLAALLIAFPALRPPEQSQAWLITDRLKAVGWVVLSLALVGFNTFTHFWVMHRFHNNCAALLCNHYE